MPGRRPAARSTVPHLPGNSSAHILQRIDRRNGRAGVMIGAAAWMLRCWQRGGGIRSGELVGMAVAALPDAHSNIVNQISTRPAFHIWTPSSRYNHKSHLVIIHIHLIQQSDCTFRIHSADGCNLDGKIGAPCTRLMVTASLSSAWVALPARAWQSGSCMGSQIQAVIQKERPMMGQGNLTGRGQLQPPAGRHAAVRCRARKADCVAGVFLGQLSATSRYGSHPATR